MVRLSKKPRAGRENCAPGPAAPTWTRQSWPVVVIGGGNAAVVAALAAADLGARVLVLERAPKHMRGGNSRHTRNIRCVHEADDYNSGAKVRT
jgi:tricarballylate dehydrogenase